MNNVEIANFPPLDYATNEAFNTLATSLSYCGSEIKTILLTSRYAGEGKSFASMNLMRTLAGLNKRVVFDFLLNSELCILLLHQTVFTGITRVSPAFTFLSTPSRTKIPSPSTMVHASDLWRCTW